MRPLDTIRPARPRLRVPLERLARVPALRRAAKVGLPAAALLAALVWFASDPARVRAVTDTLAELRRVFEARPGVVGEAILGEAGPRSPGRPGAHAQTQAQAQVQADAQAQRRALASVGSVASVRSGDGSGALCRPLVEAAACDR